MVPEHLGGLPRGIGGILVNLQNIRILVKLLVILVILHGRILQTKWSSYMQSILWLSANLLAKLSRNQLTSVNLLVIYCQFTSETDQKEPHMGLGVSWQTKGVCSRGTIRETTRLLVRQGRNTRKKTATPLRLSPILPTFLGWYRESCTGDLAFYVDFYYRFSPISRTFLQVYYQVCRSPS